MAVINVPKKYKDAVNTFVDHKSPIAHITYAFLNVAVSKTRGTLMVIPLLCRKTTSLYKRLGLEVSPAYILIWSPTTRLNPVGNSRDIVIVMDEYEWSDSFSTTITLNGEPPKTMDVYEKLMEDCKFFTGLNCVVVTNDKGLRVVSTKLLTKDNMSLTV